MELSNELAPSMFYTPKQPQIEYFPAYSLTLDIQSFMPGVNLVGIESTGTPIPSKTSTLTVLSIHKDELISGITIQSIMLVQLRNTSEGVLAETWLEGIYEYGVGEDNIRAIEDLVISLNEYLSVLNKDIESLGDSARKELDTLQKLIGSQ